MRLSSFALIAVFAACGNDAANPSGDAPDVTVDTTTAPSDGEVAPIDTAPSDGEVAPTDAAPGDTTATASDTPPSDTGQEVVAPTVVEVRISAVDGGVITTPSGDVKLDVPAGALPADTTLTLQVRAPTAETASPVFELGPSGLTFSKSATLDVAIAAPVPDGLAAVLATWDGAAWADLPGSAVAAGRVTAPIEHFSLFAIVLRANAGVVPPSCTGQDLGGFPCGGDPAGSWTVETVCTPTPLLLVCPADGEITFTGSGNMVAGDGYMGILLSAAMVDGEVSIARDSCPQIPINPEAPPCASYQQALAAFGPTCFDESGACRCTLRKNFISGAGSAPPPIFRYSVDGNELLLSVDGGNPERTPYCAADGLRLRLPGKLVEKLIPGYQALGAAFVGGSPPLFVSGSTCIPQCTGKICGPDGCLGACGTCAQGESCVAGTSCQVQQAGPPPGCGDYALCFTQGEPAKQMCLERTAGRGALTGDHAARWSAWRDCALAADASGTPGCTAMCPGGIAPLCSEGERIPKLSCQGCDQEEVMCFTDLVTP